MKYGMILWLGAVSVVFGAGSDVETQSAVSGRSQWYRDSYYNWFMTHHVVGTEEVGREINVERIKGFLREQDPGYIGVHARGPMGWALYPCETGYPLPKLHVDLVEVFAEIAEELDKPLLIYYNLGRDKEIEKRRPEWNRIDVDGKLYPMSLSYLTRVKEEYLWPQIREIMLKYKPDAFWFDGSVYSVWPCFREETKARFREETGLEAPQSEDSPVWDAYRDFQRQVWREFTAQAADFVHGIDPECLVSFNMAYTVWMPEKPGEGVDFTTMDLGHLREDISLVTRFTDTQGIPFEILLPVRFFFMEHGSLLRPMEQMKQDAAQVIANGGIFSGWDQPGETTVFLPGHQERLIELSRWIHERRPWCHGTVSQPDASVLIIAESHYRPDATLEKFPSVKSTKMYCYPHENVRVRGACYGLNRRHVHNSVIAGWRLKEGPVRGRLLVVEDSKVVPGDVCEAIAEFAENGGTVLLTGNAIREPAAAKLIGAAPGEGEPRVQEFSISLAGGEKAAIRHRLCEVRAGQAQVILTAQAAEGERPFLTRRACGKGEVYYCGSPIFTEYSYTQVPGAVAGDILERVLPERERRLVVDGPETVEVSLRSKGAMQVIHLVNKAQGSEEGRQFTRVVRDIPAAGPCKLELKAKRRPASVTLEPGGRKATWEYKNGRVSIDVPGFAIYEIVAVTTGE